MPPFEIHYTRSGTSQEATLGHVIWGVVFPQKVATNSLPQTIIQPLIVAFLWTLHSTYCISSVIFGYSFLSLSIFYKKNKNCPKSFLNLIESVSVDAN